MLLIIHMSIINVAEIVHHFFFTTKMNEDTNKEIAILGRKKSDMLGGLVEGNSIEN